jgi:hypothetical protein
MSDSLIQFPAIASGASFAGTCLMHTMMFTEFFLLVVPPMRNGCHPELSKAKDLKNQVILLYSRH